MEVNLGEVIISDPSQQSEKSCKEQVSHSHTIIFEKEMSSRLKINS